MGRTTLSFGSVLGSDWGGGSEAGSELASELSHSVFADAPPVLLTAAQLQHHYASAGVASQRGADSEEGNVLEEAAAAGTAAEGTAAEETSPES